MIRALSSRPRPTSGLLSVSFAAIAVATLLNGCGGVDTPENEAPALAPRPNILLICIDALRADHVGVYGYPMPTTPNIDALATEGIYFSNMVAHSTWTKPSIATLMTSLYSSQHGIHRVAVGPDDALRTEILDDSFVTLAERLTDSGYATGAVINQVHLAERFGFAQGFETYNHNRGKGAFQLNQMLDDWLLSLPGDRPFFAYLHYLDLHWPYNKRLDGMGDAFGSTDMKNQPPRKGIEALAWGQALNDEEDLRALVARYDHELAFSDAGVGDVVQRLRKAGLYEDTLILVTSDHGEAFLEHGMLGHGFAPHDELMRIPLVVRLPESMRSETGRVDTPVGLIDVMPTLLELAGADPEPQAQGDSFAFALRGEAPRARILFAEAHEGSAARTASEKLIRFRDGSLEFYDLARDPGENEASVGDCTGRCREIAKPLAEFARTMERSRESTTVGTADLTDEDVESLRALGYLD